MAQRDHADDRASDAASKFYLPAGTIPPFDTSRFGRLLSSLFNQDGESQH